MNNKQQQQQFNEIARDPLAFLIKAVGGKSNPRPPQVIQTRDGLAALREEEHAARKTATQRKARKGVQP